MLVYLDIVAHCIHASFYGDTLALDFDNGTFLDLEKEDQEYQEALNACQDLNLFN